MKPVHHALGLLATCTVLNAFASDAAPMSKGEYLARAADCVACHVVPGGKPYAGGLEFKLPFGTIYSPNITADMETGIGSWTDDDFVSAVQSGVGKDGKHYYPAFPYTSYTLMPREDILAIKEYLFSLPPVKQKPPENKLSFPFNQRWGMMFWNVVFASSKRFEPDSKQSAEWNRGAYLVQGPGHCGECHTPRNLFQAMSSGRPLAGADIGNWHAYNISSDPTYGIGAWPEEALISYLGKGYASGYGGAGGPMTDAVEHSLKYLTPADLKAIAVYLKSAPAQAEGVARPTVAFNPAPLKPDLGSKLFNDNCVGCHLLDGSGRQSPAGGLAGLKTINDPTGKNLIATLLEGHTPLATRADQRMPHFGRGYNDTELAALSNFVLQRFGSANGRIEPEDVTKSRESALH
ncbi:c-type cytochrome [Pseudomonas sp. NPDC090202]|uniref:c-type cytochrome n=1 Tax=unclassified Pseudomonas TaxID=196821 RepID=UPI0038298EBB